MGLTRKSLSIMTLGAIDFRSDRERTAAYTKGIRRQAKAQRRLMKTIAKRQRQQAAAMQP